MKPGSGVMKLLVTILLIFSTSLSFAQRHRADFSAIDYRVLSIHESNLDSLSLKLVTPYSNDLQKVRAIFRWIAENIAYKTLSRYKRVSPVRSLHYEAEDDTGALKPLNIRVAENVLRKREAVCDGYSRLFKALCDAAGIRSEIIIGFARGNNRGGIKFRSNHSWNAVFIDSSWHLLDVTWASGFISFGGDYNKHFDEHYFLTPPDLFIQDHFPEDLQWTLLPNPPTLREFHHSPFKHSAFIKHKILSYKPTDGIIEASIGDKLVFELETEDAKDNLVVASGNISDSSLISALWLFAKPNAIKTGNKLSYTFTVEDATEQWLHIIYKGDVIMRYKLRIKKDTVAR
jgi:transglutaminase/protease-like cytokinesis protein 3